MTPEELRQLLRRVQAEETTIDDACAVLRRAPFVELEDAHVDQHRALRCGFPEVIFCQGKRPESIRAISQAILSESDVLLATRADAAAAAAVREAAADAEYHELARCVTVIRTPVEPRQGKILILSAGTADVPVAEEARITAEFSGAQVETVYDVGVAGIHRLLAAAEHLQSADAIVVVAGMEGALASVVGGMVDCPVVAVPTSVGYGTSLGGLAPLLTMLNSCAAGVSVVNIDNGFNAGYIAAQILRRISREAPSP